MKNHNVVTLLGSVTSNVNYYTKNVKYLFLQIVSKILSCRISSCHAELVSASILENITRLGKVRAVIAEREGEIL